MISQELRDLMYDLEDIHIQLHVEGPLVQLLTTSKSGTMTPELLMRVTKLHKEILENFGKKTIFSAFSDGPQLCLPSGCTLDMLLEKAGRYNETTHVATLRWAENE